MVNKYILYIRVYSLANCSNFAGDPCQAEALVRRPSCTRFTTDLVSLCVRMQMKLVGEAASWEKACLGKGTRCAIEKKCKKKEQTIMF